MNDLRVRAWNDYEEDQRSALMDAVLRRMREDDCAAAARSHLAPPQCICRCYKSGDRDVPNHRTEACEAIECICHQENV